jgi:hypothetical protein
MANVPSPDALSAAIAPSVNSTPGYTMATAGKFEQAMQHAEAVQSKSNSVVDSLLSLNEHSAALAEQAESLQDRDMKPSELMMLTMRSHEFLFHCELVSNVANRSSDGVQQLFRQQS